MNTDTMKKKAIIASLVGNTIFGFSFLASKIALNHTTPMVLLTTRFLIAFAILTVMAALGVIKVQFKGKHVVTLALLGVFQPVVYFLFENYGVQMTNSSIGGIIISLVPIVNFFLGSTFLKEHFRIQQLLWAILSVVGVCILSINGSMGGNLNMLGILCLIGAVLSAGVFSVLSRGLSEEFSPIERTYGMFLIGAIAFPLLGLIQTKGHLFGEIVVQLGNPEFLIAVLYLAVLSSIIAYFTLNYAVTYLPIRQSSSFTSLTSVISVVAGAVILHEPVTMIQLFGIILILVGVYMVNQGSAE